MAVQSICTLSNASMLGELLIMLRSFDLFNKSRIYVGCDAAVAKALGALRLTQCEVIAKKILPAAPGALEFKAFKALTANKMVLMDEVLRTEPSVVWYDADMLFLNQVTGIDLVSYEVTLTPHYMLAAEEAKWGRFNSGCVGTRSRAFVRRWGAIAAATRGVTADQEYLMKVVQLFKVQELGTEHNFGPWKLHSVAPEEGERRRALLTVDDTVRYDGKPLVSFHSHLRRFPLVGGFNDVVMGVLNKLPGPRYAKVREWVLATDAR